MIQGIMLSTKTQCFGAMYVSFGVSHGGVFIIIFVLLASIYISINGLAPAFIPLATMQTSWPHQQRASNTALYRTYNMRTLYLMSIFSSTCLTTQISHTKIHCHAIIHILYRQAPFTVSPLHHPLESFVRVQLTDPHLINYITSLTPNS